MPDHVYNKDDVIRRLEACLNKTLGEIDSIGLFNHIRDNEFSLQKGVAGAIVEQCIFGYPPDTAQEADLIIKDNGVEERTELKTTGMVIDRRPEPHFIAKEPMSITAVGIFDIASQEFETSHFWDKLARMLIVYYHYASRTAVSAYEYREFPLKGYEFHRFSEEEKETLRADWEYVRNLCSQVVSHHPGVRDGAWRAAVRDEYIEVHGQLRRVLSFIDLAPKFPPRFRLKKPTVSAMIARHFGYELEQLPGRYTTVTDIDFKCHELTARYKGKTIGELAHILGVPYSPLFTNKSISEQITVAMFGGDCKKLNRIAVFEQFGLIAKSVVVTSTGKRTEDMKLFRVDFTEIAKREMVDEDGTIREVQFEDSELYSYFADHEFLCIIFEEPPARTVEYENGIVAQVARHFGDNRFVGFKRLVFSDEFIDGVVRRVWDDTRDKILNGTLTDVVVRRQDGTPVRNRSGSISSAPNFIKSRENVVFIRGGAATSEDRCKTECVNGIRMIPQFIWIKGTAIVDELEKTPEI